MKRNELRKVMPETSNIDNTASRVAVLGTGTMGAAMARRLLTSRFMVTVWNRNPEKIQPLVDAGARAAADPAEAVHDADIVLTMLFDEAAVVSVAAQFLAAARPGTVWMQSSTIGADGMGTVAAAASTRHVPIIDAPVLGTKDPAERGTLTVLASGESAAIVALQPVFDAIGSRTIVVGDRLGAASDLKLVCNTWVASLTAGVAQSVALARDFGLDPAQFIDAVAGSASDSPYVRIKGATLLEDARAPQFALDGLLKDLRLAQRTAGPSNTTPYLDSLEHIYAAASHDGHGHEDVAWVYDAIDNPMITAASARAASAQ
jgi:3-hydroxyisobutyrate dehydrogenase